MSARFTRSHRRNFTEEVFIVSRRWQQYPDWGINLYALQDLTGEKIEGKYYEQELKEAHFDEKQRKVKKVLSKRKSGDLVSFYDYSKKKRKN